MSMAATRKRELLGRALTMLARRFDVVPMGEHARRLQQSGRLGRKQPDLAQ